MPKSSKYQFKKISSKVFRRDPWKSNEQSGTEFEKQSDWTLETGTGTSHQHDTEIFNLPMDLDNLSSHFANPTPINIQPHLDFNVIDEEECTSSIDFRSEILSDMNSCNRKLYEYMIKLKDLVCRIDKLLYQHIL